MVPIGIYIMMPRRVFFAMLLLIGTAYSAAVADTVTFMGTSRDLSGKPAMLTGKLTKPLGKGPFPAVVMLHGCSGIKSREDVWAERLASWGYVALQVDSLTPRGHKSVCAYPRTLHPDTRSRDAHDASSYLGGLPFVDRNRIAVMGWSHGGWTTLHAIQGKNRIQELGDNFRAAVAFYPYCDIQLEDLTAPLLILIGKRDDWCPTDKCSSVMPSGKAAHEVILKIYPEAYHCFDWKGMDKVYKGHRLLYDPAAAADAIVKVQNFLEKYLE
jgi:dienelactone hydrolase